MLAFEVKTVQRQQVCCLEFTVEVEADPRPAHHSRSFLWKVWEPDICALSHCLLTPAAPGFALRVTDTPGLSFILKREFVFRHWLWLLIFFFLRWKAYRRTFMWLVTKGAKVSITDKKKKKECLKQICPLWKPLTRRLGESCMFYCLWPRCTVLQGQ